LFNGGEFGFAGVFAGGKIWDFVVVAVDAKELFDSVVVGSEVGVGDGPVFTKAVSAGCFEVDIGHSQQDAAIEMQAATQLTAPNPEVEGI